MACYTTGMLLHASCVAISGKGVLIAGPPGAGKSDLALRLIDEGAQLVADDQTELKIENGMLTARAPSTIRGMIEARHVGLLEMPYAIQAVVTLYVELVSAEEKLERLPETETISLLGIPVQKLRLPAFAASTPAKIRAVLKFTAGRTAFPDQSS